MIKLASAALKADLRIRQERVRIAMEEEGYDALLVTSNVNLLYLSGSIYGGAAYLPAEGEPIFFVRRPQVIEEGNICPIRKLEDIPALIQHRGGVLPRRIMLENDESSYSDIKRQRSIFPDAEYGNATALLRRLRMIKTPGEIELFRRTAAVHGEVYTRIPSLYKPGMTDKEFQIAIEHLMRSYGSEGIFRTYGSAMEIYMGNVIVGDNAESPSPYDFAMGGGGTDALPLGANGSPMEEGMCVMVDMAGNYSAYISDMTRSYAIGKVSDEALRLHDLSREIQAKVMESAEPGMSCADLYNRSVEMVEAAGASDKFMGTKQQAKFVGHGIGLQINEMPVLMARSKEVLTPGMVIAFEPKFVLPGIGAVGNENSFLVTESGVEKLTICSEELIDLSAVAK
ncbi:peptidase M24 [Porphyromonas gulae]|uniref:Peptidase M24 n=1 Tax=Porphyromonas gulae TaxID=111105 RepID=A0A0A2EIA2_9PORP|nr:Xaa-Pro peptidase family protein [Porphyromonas gulae]KGN76134.1 peptidase M24 [Porphyromonas gulae]KGN92305.1 peptidase M24 [Porphyromonas gulae]